MFIFYLIEITQLRRVAKLDVVCATDARRPGCERCPNM